MSLPDRFVQITERIPKKRKKQGKNSKMQMTVQQQRKYFLLFLL